MNPKMQIQTIRKWLGSGSINVFGMPFAGKDTQGRKLAELFGGELISGGDILRHDQGNAKIQEIMAAGGIIPIELFEEVVVPFLSRPELSGKPLILSEVGRQDGEEKVIEKATKASGHPQKAIVYLFLEAEEVWRRFEESKQEHDRGNRQDDKSEVLQTRINNYAQKVVPVIEYYRNKGLLLQVDGRLTREEVTQEVLDDLYRRATIGAHD